MMQEQFDYDNRMIDLFRSDKARTRDLRSYPNHYEILYRHEDKIPFLLMEMIEEVEYGNEVIYHWLGHEWVFKTDKVLSTLELFDELNCFEDFHDDYDIEIYKKENVLFELDRENNVIFRSKPPIEYNEDELPNYDSWISIIWEFEKENNITLDYKKSHGVLNNYLHENKDAVASNRVAREIKELLKELL